MWSEHWPQGSRGADANRSFLEEGVGKDGCQATLGASIYSDDVSLFFPPLNIFWAAVQFALGIGIVSIFMKGVLLWLTECR